MKTIIFIIVWFICCCNSDKSSSQNDDILDTSDSDSNKIDSETGGDCEALGWECGVGKNEIGVMVDCDIPGCANEARWCDEHICRDCASNEHCGTTCEDCTARIDQAQVCSLDATTCVECNGDTDCAAGNYCDTDSHACATCDENFACGSSCTNCTATTDTPICRADGEQCVQCNDSINCDTDTPVCDAAANTCHECLQDAHCRADTAAHPSPLGICTPDRTCTCIVDGSNLTANCTSTSCPDGYVCAEDLTGSNHYSCLTPCSLSSSENGVGCYSRASGGSTVSVWAPATTCYAFEQFGLDCSGNADVCSVDGAGGVADATCVDESCKFVCWDSSNTPQDSWCPSDAPTCGPSITSPYCE